MTLPSKTSRRIVVGDKSYRWMVSDNVDMLSLSVQSEDVQGALLYVNFSRNADLPGFRDAGSEQVALTSGKVADIIREALRNGWRATERGPRVTYLYGSSGLEPTG